MVCGLALLLPVRAAMLARAYFFSNYHRWIGVGEFLREKVSGESPAAGTPGDMPLFSDLDAVDILGLVGLDRPRAHGERRV